MSKKKSDTLSYGEDCRQKECLAYGEIQNKVDAFLAEANTDDSLVLIKSTAVEVAANAKMTQASFEIRLKTQKYDPYLQNEDYRKGQVYVNLSGNFFQQMNLLSQKHFGKVFDYNNTGSTFWVIIFNDEVK